MPSLRWAIAAVVAVSTTLSGCSGITPQPSHGATNTPSGVTVYGTVDVGIGKNRSAGSSGN